MENVEKKSYDMNLKRAIKITHMPKDWFNTDEKIDLFNKANEFIMQHKDFQTVVNRDEIYHAKDVAATEASKMFYSLVEKDEKLKTEYDKYTNETNNKSTEQEIVEMYKDEKFRSYISKYRNNLNFFNPEQEAKRNLNFGTQNCAEHTKTNVNLETGERNDKPYSEIYIEYFNGIIENIKKEQEKESKSIKNRILKFFKRDKGNKKDERDDVVEKLTNLIGNIEEVMDAKSFIDDVKKTCNDSMYKEFVKDKVEEYHLAKKNVIAELDFNPEDPDLETKINRVLAKTENGYRNFDYYKNSRSSLDRTARKEVKHINNYRSADLGDNDLDR